MSRPGTSFALAVASAVLAPVLLAIEFLALFVLGRAIYGPEYSLLAKALSVGLIVAIGLLALALPALAVVSAIRARRASTTESGRASGLATAAVVIGAIVGVAVVGAQVYLALLGTGVCGLDGC